MCVGVAVKEETLADMVQDMTDDVGLVHQLPFTCDREGFAATVEKVGNQSDTFSHPTPINKCSRSVWK